MTGFVRRLKVMWKASRKAWSLAPHLDDLHAAFEDRANMALTPHERELLENALAFSQITADDVSVPRAQIVALPQRAGLEETLRVFAESAHSRLPVVGKGLDDVQGFVLLKDVVAQAHALRGKEKDFSLAAVARALPVVPETMPLPKVLQAMRRAKVAMVLVVDELGDTSGLACLLDILEELVGDMADELDEGTEALVKLEDGTFAVRGSLPLEEFDAAAGTALLKKFGHEVETVGGAVLLAAKKVPAKGEKVKLSAKVEATVSASNGRRVLAVALKVLP
ncbi:MAG: CBS domain-containing protein [Proteobacteria bacterium]|nr:CBS domain-containing protein [Pseudomonadota bacterium]